MMIDYLYQDTITVFNRYEMDGSIIWIPHILKNVHCSNSNGARVATYGDSATDSATVNVRYFGGRDNPKIDAMDYLKPKQFRQLEYSEAKNHITFSYGDQFDFFIVGKWEESEEIKDDEYAASGGFFNYMNKKYDEVYAISSCAKYDYLPHFTISGG